MASTAQRRPRKQRQIYKSVYDWQVATGTSNRALAKRIGVHESHLCNVLKKSRRCSFMVAWKLHKITGVPMEEMVAWGETYRKTA